MKNRTSTNVTVEIKKKHRRRPMGLDALEQGNTEQSEDINNFLDLVKKDKEKRAQEEIIKKEAQMLEEQKKEALEESSSEPQSSTETIDVATEETKESIAKKLLHKHKEKEFEDAQKGSETIEESKSVGKLGVKHPINKGRQDFEQKRSANKLLIQSLGVDEEREKRSIASIKRARDKARRLHHATSPSHEKQVREVILPEFITVSELASRMAEKGTDVVKAFMRFGTMVNLSQTIDADTAEVVVAELGHKVKRVTDADIENILIEKDDESHVELIKRPPVVTIVGHVDHGKTSLLDALRETDVTSQEAGGITQHIGAYQVKLANGEHITFIDTPGHEAFTAMRSRGVNATDVVVLVVAADDGVKAQTVEAISHAKAAKVPIIVAINKMDKEGADPNRVMTELLSHDLVAESMGGDIMTVEISALKKLNLDKLEEAILLQAEMLELKAINSGKARGVVIESRLDKSLGVVATLLVQKGTLRKGDLVVAGGGFGKIKSMVDDKNHQVNEAYPSMPVEVTGFDVTPKAGDNFNVMSEEKQAREIAEYRRRKVKEQKEASRAKSSLEELLARASIDKSKNNSLPIIIKADVQGSLEAIHGSIKGINSHELKISILHEAIGGINESDVGLANASNALILAFNVRANSNAKLLAEKEKIDIRYYSIIYELIDDLKRIISGMLEPTKTEKYLGRAEIRQVFVVSKVGKIAGAFVTDGVLKRGVNVRLIRDDVVIHDGKLKTLRRFKDDVKEVNSGYECGIAFENYSDIKEGDVLEVYQVVEEQRKI